MSDKLTKKQLKEPDSFQKLGVEAQSFFVTHQSKVIGAVVGLVVIGFVAAIVHLVRQKSSGSSMREFGKAFEVVSRGVDPSGAAPAPNVPAPFKTEEERDAAVVDSLNAYLATHSDASSTYAARLAVASASFRLGRAEPALAAYDQAAKDFPKADPVRAVAFEGRGYAHEAKNDLDLAFNAFGEMAKANDGDMLKGMGLYHQGRIRLAQNQKDEAAKLFTEVTTAAAGTTAARFSEERLAQLAAQGVALPPKAAPAPGADEGTKTP